MGASHNRRSRPPKRRRLQFESLENRLPFALDITIEPPVVASFVNSAQLIGLESSLSSQTPTGYVFDSSARRTAAKALNGVLYSFDGAQVFTTNLTTGSTQVFSVTPLAGSVGAEVRDVGLIGGEIRFVGGSLTGNAAIGKRTIPTMWQTNGAPTRIGPDGKTGLANAVLDNGLVVGFYEDSNLEVVPWVHTATGDFKLPSVDSAGTVEQVLSGSESNFLLNGTIGTELLIWQLDSIASEGEYELVFSPARPLDYPPTAVFSADGASYRVVEGAFGDAYIFGQYYLPSSSGGREYHVGRWSISGAQTFDFGPNTVLRGVKALGDTMIVAHQSSISFLSDDRQSVVNLDDVLGQAPSPGTSRSILPDGLLIAGTSEDPVLVISYAEVGSTTVHKVAVAKIKTPTRVEIDAENDGVFEEPFFGNDMAFPSFVAKSYGQRTLVAKATYNDGSVVTASATYESVPFAAVAFFNAQELLLGGTSGDDLMEVSKLGGATYRAAAAGRSQVFDEIDSISINLGEGADRLQLSAGVTVDLGLSTHVETMDAVNDTSETIQSIDEFNVAQQVGLNGTFSILVDSKDVLELIGQWSVQAPTVVNGRISARLKGEDVDLLIQSGSYHNPLRAEDVSFDSVVSARDALLIINHINNTPASGNGPPIDAYLDVNGSGSISALDVLLVINFINSRPPEGESGPSFDGHLSQAVDLAWLEEIRKKTGFD